MNGYIQINHESCKGCQICFSFCPKSSISDSRSINSSGYFSARFNDKSECNGCGICAIVCPEAAIEVYRE
ncbi:MAG: 4Fe-4S binding protein [Thermodesulfobacteriota bacterium]|nr:4Fe-4S binding protein [Thermodesulfobacteriota bacterium]